MSTATTTAPVATLSPVDLEAYLGPAVQTQAIWRMQGKGPHYIKVEGRIRYRLSDVEAWMEARTVSTT